MKQRHSEIRKAIKRAANRVLNQAGEEGITIWHFRAECEKMVGMKLHNAYLIMSLYGSDVMIDCKYFRVYKVK